MMLASLSGFISPDEFIYALLAFYAALPTIFVPLTFSLIASLKQQYTEALRSKVLSAQHDDIYRFQEKFFYYNDAFIGLLVVASISTVVHTALVLVALELAFVSFWIRFILYLALMLCSIAVASYVISYEHLHHRVYSFYYIFNNSHPITWLIWKGITLPYILIASVKRLLPRLYDPPFTPFFNKQPIDNPNYDFLNDLIESSSADCSEESQAPKQTTCIRKGLQPIRLLYWGFLGLTFFTGIVIIAGLWIHAEYLTLAFASIMCAHLFLLLLAWWDMYMVWRPFSYLKAQEAYPVDPIYRDGMLKTVNSRTPLSNEELITTDEVAAAAMEQLRSYEALLHQYEWDDKDRLTYASLLQHAPDWRGAWSKQLDCWLETYKDYLACSDDQYVPVNVVYLGCGHLDLLPAVHKLLRPALRAIDRRLQLNYHLVDICSIRDLLEFCPALKRQNAPVRESFAELDERTLEHNLDAASLMHNNLKQLTNLVIKEQTFLLDADVHSFLRELNGDFGEVRRVTGAMRQHLSTGQKAIPIEALNAQTDEVRRSILKLRACPVPPLILLLNNSLGTILDPKRQQRPHRDLYALSEASCSELLKNIHRAFRDIGYCLITHNKEHNRIAQSEGRNAHADDGLAEYNEDRWMLLQGHDRGRGLYFLGRLEHGMNTDPYLLLSRWPTKNKIEEWLPAAEDQGTWSHAVPIDYKDSAVKSFITCSYFQPKHWTPDVQAFATPHCNPKAEALLLEERLLIDKPGHGLALIPHEPHVIDFGCGHSKLSSVIAEKKHTSITRDAMDVLCLSGDVCFIQLRSDNVENVLNSIQKQDRPVVFLLWNVLHYMRPGELRLLKECIELRASREPVVVLVSAFAVGYNSPEQPQNLDVLFQPDGLLALSLQHKNTPRVRSLSCQHILSERSIFGYQTMGKPYMIVDAETVCGYYYGQVQGEQIVSSITDDTPQGVHKSQEDKTRAGVESVDIQNGKLCFPRVVALYLLSPAKS